MKYLFTLFSVLVVFTGCQSTPEVAEPPVHTSGSPLPLVEAFAEAIKRADEVVEPLIYLNTYGSPLPFLEAFAGATKQADEHLETYPIRAAIVPHHLVAAESIARVFSALQHQTVKHILLISPDHFAQCATFICTTDGEFHTLFGTVRTDATNIHALEASPLITKDTHLFEREHGIYAILPFVATYTPQALVTPMVMSQKNMMRWYSHEDELINLLQPLITKDTVVVISSDFSHYLPVFDSDLHDEETAKAIFTPDPVGIRKLSNPANSDCPNCLSLLTQLAMRNNFFNPTLVARTNSARILKDLTVPETTSHFAVVYYQNIPLTPHDPAFAGDVTLVRGNQPHLSKSATSFWQGDGLRVVNLETPLAKTCETYQNPYIFCTNEEAWKNIKDLATHWSIENNHKFDTGVDAPFETQRIIASQGEIPLDKPYENENLRIIPLTLLFNPLSVSKDVNIQKNYEQVLELLKRKQDSKLTVVFVHAGKEFFTLPSDATQKKLQSFIDAGADAVIAHHTHVPGPLVIYKGKPIFTGLGNFVFDEHNTVATETAILVRLHKENGKVLFETLHSQNKASNKNIFSL